MVNIVQDFPAPFPVFFNRHFNKLLRVNRVLACVCFPCSIYCVSDHSTTNTWKSLKIKDTCRPDRSKESLESAAISFETFSLVKITLSQTNNRMKT